MKKFKEFYLRKLNETNEDHIWYELEELSKRGRFKPQHFNILIDFYRDINNEKLANDLKWMKENEVFPTYDSRMNFIWANKDLAAPKGTSPYQARKGLYTQPWILPEETIEKLANQPGAVIHRLVRITDVCFTNFKTAIMAFIKTEDKNIGQDYDGEFSEKRISIFNYDILDMIKPIINNRNIDINELDYYLNHIAVKLKHVTDETIIPNNKKDWSGKVIDYKTPLLELYEKLKQLEKDKTIKDPEIIHDIKFIIPKLRILLRLN